MADRVKITHSKTGKLLEHNISTYNGHGCRCAECTADMTSSRARLRASRASGAPVRRRGRPRRVLSSDQAQGAAQSPVIK